MTTRTRPAYRFTYSHDSADALTCESCRLLTTRRFRPVPPEGWGAAREGFRWVIACSDACAADGWAYPRKQTSEAARRD
jgi:hypothetical protein